MWGELLGVQGIEWIILFTITGLDADDLGPISSHTADDLGRSLPVSCPQLPRVKATISMAIPQCLHIMYNLTLYHSLFLINHYVPCWGNLKETLLAHSKISGASGKASQPAINNRLIMVLLWLYPYYREGSGRCHEKTWEIDNTFRTKTFLERVCHMSWNLKETKL